MHPMAHWLNARKTWSFFLVIAAVLFAGNLAIDGIFTAYFHARGVNLGRDVLQSLGWAAGLTFAGRLILRVAASPCATETPDDDPHE
jgi:hypothetical protein